MTACREIRGVQQRRKTGSTSMRARLRFLDTAQRDR
jgi:hypothetical protein